MATTVLTLLSWNSSVPESFAMLVQNAPHVADVLVAIIPLLMTSTFIVMASLTSVDAESLSI
eukprot:11047836-Heterocapsa_arctica.AAC.1